MVFSIIIFAGYTAALIACFWELHRNRCALIDKQKRLEKSRAAVRDTGQSRDSAMAGLMQAETEIEALKDSVQSLTSRLRMVIQEAANKQALNASAIKSLTNECQRLRAQRDEAFTDHEAALDEAALEKDLQRKLQEEQLEGVEKLERATWRIKELQKKLDRQEEQAKDDEDDVRSICEALAERARQIRMRYDR